MTAACRLLHELVEKLPEERWPFITTNLPRNGIYFFQEVGEPWGMGAKGPESSAWGHTGKVIFAREWRTILY
jgi:hypothetical protein